MDVLISHILLNIKKSNVNWYEANRKRVEEAFPKMSGNTKEFLASAEQMYEVFKGNVKIDFAPIMVEYCKVFENLLWEYLDRTKEYSVEIQNNSRKNKCLGTAGYVIKKGGDGKSLSKYRDIIKRITDLRNGSAHKHVTKEDPDVLWIHDLIWNGELVTLLCNT